MERHCGACDCGEAAPLPAAIILVLGNNLNRASNMRAGSCQEDVSCCASLHWRRRFLSAWRRFQPPPSRGTAAVAMVAEEVVAAADSVAVEADSAATASAAAASADAASAFLAGVVVLAAVVLAAVVLASPPAECPAAMRS
jgi:hypothetical protein